MARPRHPSPADRAGDHGLDDDGDGHGHGLDEGDDGDDHGNDDNHALSLLFPWISGPFCIFHQLSTGSLIHQSWGCNLFDIIYGC